jgi:hypothetical protein
MPNPENAIQSVRSAAINISNEQEFLMPAPRAYWKGSLKLSLVTCPVALYPASTTVG